MGSLKDQIKTPIVILYNIRTEAVASNIRDIAPGVDVVSFKYKYDDENDDECTIKIQSASTEWLDSLNITINTTGTDVDNKVIHLSWGYVGGPITSRRTVVVRDVKSHYGSNEIYTELICSDFTTYLKLTQSSFINKISPIEYIKQYCTGVVNIIIKAQGKLLYKQDIDEKYGATKDILNVTVTEKNKLWDYIEGLTGEESKSPKRSAKYEVTTEAIPTGTWYESDDGSVREFLEKERDVNVISKSPYSVLVGIMQKAPNGPWYISGRDNTLIIHNRTLGGGNYKNYRYAAEPGDLIDFSAETKYENFMKRSISYNSMDPLTRQAKFLDSYVKALLKAKRPGDILESNLPDTEREKKLQEWLDLYQGGYQTLKTLYSKYEVTSLGNIFMVDEYRSYDPSKEKPKVLNPITYNKFGPSDFVDLSQVVQDGIYYTTPVADDEEELNLVNNAARQLAMEKEEAKIIIEGDPDIRSGYTIGILGVQRIHKGNYYIKTCEHQISNMGYKVTMDGFKVVDDTGVLNFKTNESYITAETIVDGKLEETMRISHKEKFDIEGDLFRRWKIKVSDKATYNYSASFGQQNSVDVIDYKYVDFKEYLSNHPDTKAQDIIKLWKEGKLVIEENTEAR